MHMRPNGPTFFKVGQLKSNICNRVSVYHINNLWPILSDTSSLV